MSLKEIAVEGCQFIITVGGVVIGTGTVKIIEPSLPSENTKISVGGQKKGVYTGPLSVSVSGYSDTAISGGFGSGLINSTATKTTVDSQPVMLEGDSGEIVLSGSNPSSGSPVTGYVVVVKISSAGQTACKAE